MKSILTIPVIAALATLLVASSVVVANPNREPMTLDRSEYAEFFDEQNYGGPNGCQDEDDKDRRWYSGWLAPGESFYPAPVIFCSPVTDGTGSGNTGAWLEVVGDTRYRIEWWVMVPHQDGTVERVELVPILIESRPNGRPHEYWVGCVAKVSGPVYATVTNIGSRGASTVLGFGSQWHNTWDVFYYDNCP